MRLPRWLKYTLTGLAALVALVAVALVVLVNTIDLDRHARLAIAAVKTATGRELAIRGQLEVSVFPRLAVRAEDVSFANPAWGSRPQMVTAKRIEGAVALLPLLHRRIEITRLAVTDLDLLLETDAKGTGNWVFKPPVSAPAATPSDSSRGVGFDIAEIRDLIARDGAWPLDAVVATDGAQATVKGSIDWRAALPGLDLAVGADLKHTAGLAKLLGTPLDLPMPATLTASSLLPAASKSPTR